MITGNQNPVAGKDEFYTFTDYTQMFETPDIQYNWAIWKKKTGKWVNITERPPKPGKSVSFNFGQGAIGEEFRLEVYKAKKKLLSDEWEAKKMGEIFVVPTNSKTPKISKVVLFNRGARDPNKASYQDTLIAQAHCVAMFNQEVEFNLWEDDAEGGGHNAEINKNNKAPKIYKARVNEKGIAEAKISLLSDANVLKQIANRYMMRGDPNEGANHEFYVTASYSGKIKGDSKVNVSVANPDHRPKTKPKDYTPKFPIGSTGAGGGVRQPDPVGKIRDVYFVNNNGQQLSKVSIGEHVKIRILSKNMIGKRIQYVVWEYDATSNDEVYRSGVIKIIADACDTGGFTISPNIFDKGIDFGSVDSDAKKQNYFIEIISFDTSNTSKKFGVTADGLMTVEKAKSAAVVQNTPAPERPRDGKCPRCEKLTIEEINSIFTTANESNKKALLNAFNEANISFEINTCLRKAHFFAQVLAEVGTDLKLNEPEGFNYSVRRLKGGDYVKGTNWVKGNLNPKEGGYFSNGQQKDWKASPFSYFKKNPNEAELYGRKDLNTYNDKGLQAANSRAIANIVYADKNRSEKYKLGNIYDGDGWKFMGKGIIQVTGRTNYTEVNKRLIKKGYNFDIVTNPDNLLKYREGVLSSMAFWYWKDLQLRSKGGVEVVDGITKIVNEATETYEQRRKNFERMYSIFQVAKCGPMEEKKEEVRPNADGKLLFPFRKMPLNHPNSLKNKSYSDYDYTKHELNAATFGYRRGKDRIHAARDLYYDPGETIYAIYGGIVKRVHFYYYDTWAIEIEHDYEYKKGHKLIALYGEVNKNGILVKENDKVKRGDPIAKVGLLDPYVKQPYPDKRGMLHLELYTGEAEGGLSTSTKLSDMLYAKSDKYSVGRTFKRRKDLFDPLQLLNEMLQNSKNEGFIK